MGCRDCGFKTSECHCEHNSLFPSLKKLIDIIDQPISEERTNSLGSQFFLTAELATNGRIYWNEITDGENILDELKTVSLLYIGGKIDKRSNMFHHTRRALEAFSR